MTKLLIAAAVAAALATPALAYQTQTAPDGREVVVLKLKDVDFGNPRQTQAFYSQVKIAAEDACDMPVSALAVTRADRECVARAVGAAVREAQRPALSAAYDRDVSSERHALAGNDQ